MKSVRQIKPKVQMPVWTNHDLVLHHGTTKFYAKSVMKAVDLKKCDDGSDFGKGFYTTTSLEQAQIFANSQVKYLADDPAIVSFFVPRDLLASLESVWFVRSLPEATDYWRIVSACRALGETNRGGIAWYDIAIGPVSKSFEERTAWIQYDQVSFHTPKSIKVLNKCNRQVSFPNETE